MPLAHATRRDRWELSIPAFDGQTVDLDREPADPHNVFVEEVEGSDAVLVGYLWYHDRGAWADYDEGDVHEGFRSEEAAHETIRALERAGKVFFTVSSESHGPYCRYLLECPYSESDWDWQITEGKCLYVPPDDKQEQYRDEVEIDGEEAAMKSLMKFSRLVLENYAHYINGSVFNWTVEHWKRDEDTGLPDCVETEDGSVVLGMWAAEEELLMHIRYHDAHPKKPDPAQASAPA